MVLKSLVDNQEYFWIKVPRTATQSFGNFFTQYNDPEPDAVNGKHYHYSYVELREMYNKVLPAVSVVRHPLSRFKSIMYYLADRFMNVDSDVNLLWHSTESCVKFLNSTFDRNCHLKHGSLPTIFIETGISNKDSVDYHGAISAFFKTQVFWAYHPKLKIFRYEKLEEFTDWIDTHLGYDINTIRKLNASSNDGKVNVDFNNPEFVKTIENMYYIDYKLFGYPLQYLT
jgi:hypothetical protein